jgi:alcohol dehydrogenase class IV
MDTKIISFRTSHLILAGFGASERLGSEAKALGATKALLVTDRGVIESGTGKKIKDLLEKEGIGVDIFDQVIPDPDVACVEKCIEMAKKRTYDLIVGVGGGSPMDIASITSVMLTNPGTVYDYFGINLVKNPGIPTILIPTTAGTGAEATPNAILTDTKQKLKKAVVSPYILPRAAIVDPLLAISMPPSVTSSSGIDALTHAVESYTSNNATILTDLFAKEAIMMIGRSIRTAVANGNNLEARYDMSLGSLYAGIALTNAGVTAVHALAYPLGGQFNVAHGIANGLLLPYVMEFNVLGSIQKFAQIAQFLGEKADHLPLLEQAYQAARAVKAIYRDLKIPQSLTELKIPKEAIPGMAKAASNVTRLMGNNPRAMTIQDVERIYEKVF